MPDPLHRVIIGVVLMWVWERRSGSLHQKVGVPGLHQGIKLVVLRVKQEKLWILRCLGKYRILTVPCVLVALTRALVQHHALHVPQESGCCSRSALKLMIQIVRIAMLAGRLSDMKQ